MSGHLARTRFFVAALALTALLPLFGASRAAAAIKVAKKAPTVEHKVFDAAKPPANMPHLNPGEIAVCNSTFMGSVELKMSQRSGRQPNGKYQYTLTITSVQAQIGLDIQVWVPLDASDKIKAHEEGHHDISQKMYAEVADHAIRVAGEKLDGHQFEGEGDTAAAAEKEAKEAMNAAHSEMIRAYFAETSAAGMKVQEEYDRLTHHGMNLDLAEADAIKQAWAADTPPLWVAPKPPTTKPTTRPAVRMPRPAQKSP